MHGWRLAFAALLVAARFGPAKADIMHARLDRLDRVYEVHADLTYVETTDVDFTLFTARGLRERERSTKSFFPGAQALEVVEAWVDQPDGARVLVAASGIFTRPSEATQNAPGFSSSMTTTVLYPQLRPGSRTHIRWRLIQRTPSPLGFNVWAEPSLEYPLGLGRVTVTFPASLQLHWRTRGFEVGEETAGAVHVLTARIAGTHAEEPERDMVATADFQPVFLVTSLPRLEEIGAIYWRQSHDRAVVTPEIAALAQKVAGGRDTEGAARAVYDWVARNIRYVALYMDPNDGWVPHSAEDVLRAGYGDCKDHVVLMQAMLAALGVRAQAAVIDWGDRTTDAPLWMPQFNHALVYLPDLDRFVNPTNPYARFDSLDRRLSGKTAVVATPEGRVVRTPPSRPAENAYAWEASVTLDADGAFEGAARATMSANVEAAVRASVARASSPDDLAERLLVDTPEGGFGTLQASDVRSLAEPLSLTATWRSPHAVVFQAGEAFVPIPVGPDFEPALALRRVLSPRPRRHAALIGARDNSWATMLRLPSTVSVGHMPDDVTLSNEAGSYTATYQRTEHGVRATRRLVIGHDIFRPLETQALEELVYAAVDDARSVVTLDRRQAEAQAVH